MRPNQDTISVLDMRRFSDQLTVHHNLVFFCVFSVWNKHCTAVVLIII